MTGTDPSLPPDDETLQARAFAGRYQQLPAAGPWTSATSLLIALNVAVFVFMAAFFDAGWLAPESMRPYNLFAANNGAATTDGEWWRLVTSMFAHFGPLHLLVNMGALFSIGRFLERLLGRALFLLIYLAAGIEGGLLSIAWNGDRVWSAGASGAIFGLYGALIGWLLHEKSGLPGRVFRFVLITSLLFAGLNIFSGLARPGIDNACHLGGFTTGIVLGWLTALPVDLSVRARRARARFWLAAGLAAGVTALGVAFTPRFDYSVRDELAWADANKGWPEKEQAIIRKNNDELARYQRDGDNGPAYAAWLTAEVIPFYTHWAEQLAALHLEPHRITAGRADIIREVLRVKIAGYQQLARGVQAKDQAGVTAYVQAEQAAITLLRRLDNGKAKP